MTDMQRMILRSRAVLCLAILFITACVRPHSAKEFGDDWKTRTIAPGIAFKQREFEGDLFNSKQRISVLEIDLTVPSVSVRPLLVAVPGRCERTSDLAEKSGAVVAVNHWLCCGREWTCEMNTLFKTNGVTAHSQIDWGTGATYAFGITKDRKAMITPVKPGSDWPESDQAGTGYGLVLLHGEISDEYKREGYNYEPPFWKDRHPRTGVCTVDEQHMKFVTVDGRSESAQGMSLQELGETMLRLGCKDGLNFDGGGSTTLWIKEKGIQSGTVTNVPSDKTGERPVVSAWGVFSSE